MTSNIVLGEYVAMIDQMDPDLKDNDKKLLYEFLRLITTRNDYELTVEDLVNLFSTFGYHKKENNVAKKLIGAREGKDYKLVHEVRGKRGGKKKNHIFLSRDYFKQLAISFPRNPVSRRLSKYFLLVEGRYREIMTEKIEKRLVTEDPYVTKMKQVSEYMQNMRDKFPLVPISYILEFFGADGVSLGKRKFGVSKGFPLRLPELVYTYPYTVHVVAVHETSNDMLALEKCVLNAVPQEERTFLDQEVVTSSAEKLKAIRDDCEKDLTKEKAKYAHWKET